MRNSGTVRAFGGAVSLVHGIDGGLTIDKV